DTTELPDGISFTYAVKAEFNDATPHPFSGTSVDIAITAVNDAPVAVADSYTMSGPKLTVPSPGPPPVPGLLANDTDDDTPNTSIKAVLVQGPANAKQFTFNPDGSFVYTPKGS